MAQKYTSINRILDKILRDPIFIGLTYEAVIDYYIDFLDIVAVPDSFITKVSELPIENYRAILPDDFAMLHQVLIEGIPSQEGTDTFHNHYPALEQALLNKPSYLINAKPTYQVQHGYIYTSIEEGKLQLSYYAIPMIDNMPAIPDEGTFLRALQNYIQLEFLKILLRNGKVSGQAFQQAEQDYYWAVGAYETSARRIDLGKGDALFTMVSSLLPNKHVFLERYKNLGKKRI